MLSRDVFFTVLDDLLLLPLALIECVFVDWVGFACHCTLVCCDFVGFNEESICWNLHAFGQLNDVANQQVVLVHFLLLALSANRNPLSAVCHRIELQKLSFFLIVIDGSDGSADDDGHQDGETFDPSCGSILGLGCAYFDRNRQETSNN